MAEPNFLKMMTDFWEAAGRTASETQKEAFKEIAGRFSVGFPFATFPLGLTSTDNASDAFRGLLNSLMDVPNAIMKATPDPKTAELLQKIISPREWLSVNGYPDQSVRQLIEGPQFADIGQLESKFAALVKASADLRTQAIQQSTLQLMAWAKAAQEFAGKLRDSKDSPLQSREQIVALWTDTANRYLFETQRSPEYLKCQRELLSASTAFKRAQNELSDYYGDMFGIPTRTEIDDLTKTVADLKHEFRADQRRRKRQGSDKRG